jgi:four helix bundle protein
VTAIYNITRDYPKEEVFGLTAQLRRSAVSIPANIAEGLTRKSRKDRLHFLNMAQASVSEVDTELEISARLGYIDQSEMTKVAGALVEVGRLLSGLSRSLG